MPNAFEKELGLELHMQMRLEPKETKFQPMNTAPLDGTPVIILYTEMDRFCASFACFHKPLNSWILFQDNRPGVTPISWAPIPYIEMKNPVFKEARLKPFSYEHAGNIAKSN